ncbi:hypothetical protein SBF1_4990007 [Candidatus Desulfosporosinus infrequens]|uniref:Uncharacterized protein n=1 Tax=Candidatus Desulfosporosinus infrequens TaxID=2043169 RepID=A0A2U3LGP1_9FIRM|nr:hypothetical protein SBF1_4990007 [Candidatus Desulfosporosinus infrequens]
MKILITTGSLNRLATLPLGGIIVPYLSMVISFQNYSKYIGKPTVQ